MAPALASAGFAGLFQVAYLVTDIEAAVAAFRASHGIAAFSVATYDLRLSDPGAVVRLKVALAWAGETEVELIEPVVDTTGVYASVAAGRDAPAAFHHVCMRLPGGSADWERFVAAQPAERIVISGGREGMRFIYLDVRDTVGHYLEYVWMSDAYLRANPGRVPPSQRDPPAYG